MHASLHLRPGTVRNRVAPFDWALGKRSLGAGRVAGGAIEAQALEHKVQQQEYEE